MIAQRYLNFGTLEAVIIKARSVVLFVYRIIVHKVECYRSYVKQKRLKKAACS